MSRLVPAIRSRGLTAGKGRARRSAMIGLIGFLALTAVVVEGPRRMCSFGSSKVEIAQRTVKKYAFEAYPRWRLGQPDRSCPASLVELNDYMNNKDIRDPYGAEYQWSCGTYAGRTKLNVWSLGEDQILGSSDDIRSSE